MAVEESDSNEATSNHVVVIFGVTGLVAKDLKRRLRLRSNWKVYGIARNPEIVPIKDTFISFSCDSLNSFETQEKLYSLQDVVDVGGGHMDPSDIPGVLKVPFVFLIF
ncbi:hypothetical protein CJ030_MR4G028438 [Morella rubra]|uniref:Uncharacterized protein n=1 Tax=Morella rubra TaxID=262757 RepID=A0A6A1W0A1_9ROSI|nr:hypothetical protein CJ030_MR4G028438 [Morella rubra]